MCAWPDRDKFPAYIYVEALAQLGDKRKSFLEVIFVEVADV
jgi:hypothetical protein